MPGTTTYPSDVAFTPAVKAIQSRKGSRHAYERVEAKYPWQTHISQELKAFIERREACSLPLRTETDSRPYSTAAVL